VGELLLGFSDHGDFGDGVDAVGEQLGDRAGRDVERVTGGEAALLHRGARQCGKADHVADGVDVREIGLILIVDLQTLAVVGRSAQPDGEL